MGNITKTRSRGIAPEETIAIVPTGIVDDPRCIADIHQLAEEILRPVAQVNRKLRLGSQQIKQIIVAGPPSLAAALDDITKSSILVTYHHQSFRRFLDDESESEDDYSIPSVIRDRPPIARILASLKKLPDEEIPEFDLNDPANRARITGDVIRYLDPRRYHHARRKAQCKRLEHLTNDWFDRLPTAGHVAILADGKTDHQHVVNQTNGDSKWIKYPTPCEGDVIATTLDNSGNSCLSWTQAAVFDPRYHRDLPYLQLNPDQQQMIHQWLTEAEREKLGFPRQTMNPSHNSANTDTASQQATASS